MRLFKSVLAVGLVALFSAGSSLARPGVQVVAHFPRQVVDTDVDEDGMLESVPFTAHIAFRTGAGRGRSASGLLSLGTPDGQFLLHVHTGRTVCDDAGEIAGLGVAGIGWEIVRGEGSSGPFAFEATGVPDPTQEGPDTDNPDCIIWDIKDDTHFEQIVLEAFGEISIVGDPCDAGRRSRRPFP